MKMKEILKFQSLTRDSNHSNGDSYIGALSREQFQSLTRDSNHSNPPDRSRLGTREWFQSLTRDSNHSNTCSFSFMARYDVSIPHAG